MSNFVFTESINDVDKFSVIEIAKADARMMKLDALYEAVNATLASNYAEAEIKVFEENGTYDDLYMLYREASEEATEKKENIIQKIIGVIKTLCQNIKKFFTEKIAALKGGKSDEKQADEVQLDKAYPETMHIFQKILAKIKEVFGAIESKAHDKIKKVSEDASEFWEKNKTLIVCGGAGAAAAIRKMKRLIINLLYMRKRLILYLVSHLQLLVLLVASQMIKMVITEMLLRRLLMQLQMLLRRHLDLSVT